MSDVKEVLEKGLDKIEATTKQLLEDNKKAQDAQFEAIKTAMGEQGEHIQQTDKWIKDVEARSDSARHGGLTPGDNLKNAIPERDRHHIERAERTGVQDPVHKTALALWWKYQYKAVRAMREQSELTPQEWFKLGEDLERGWGFDPKLKGALGEVAGGGANIIATPVEATLMRLIRDNAVLRPLVTKMTMTSLTHQIPTENGNITAYIVPETTVITDSAVTTGFSQISITARKFAGLATLSNELLEDAILGLQEYLFTAIGEHIGILEDSNALEATGTNFTGVVAAASTNSFSGVGNTAGGDDPTYQDIVRCVYEAAQASSRVNAWFMMHPRAFRSVVGLVDTDGTPIYQFGNVPNAPAERILGYPVALTTALSILRTEQTTSTTAIYYGPPTKIIFGDKAGMSFDIDPFGLFTTAQTRVRVIKRTGIVVPVGSYFTVLHGIKAW